VQVNMWSHKPDLSGLVGTICNLPIILPTYYDTDVHRFWAHSTSPMNEVLSINLLFIEMDWHSGPPYYVSGVVPMSMFANYIFVTVSTCGIVLRRTKMQGYTE
jgi:hypothetical protein